MLTNPFARREPRDRVTPAASSQTLTPPVAGDQRRDDAWFAELRAREFSRLDKSGEVYLDFTGSALYAESHVRNHLSLLSETVFGNPHSQSVASLRSTEAIEDARRLTLGFFSADQGEYDVIFTGNASGALRLVAEGFAFGPGSHFVLSADNHNSVNGMREQALARGADVRYVRLDDELRLTSDAGILERPKAPSLYAFPAQSNFSGVQHPLSLVDVAQQAGYRVLVDAAAFAPTNPLRLDVVKPDFVALSFYKMFGYPTGVGALIVRREALAELRRPWFAGGTVEFASVQHRTHMLKAGAEGFEDGTPNFGSIAALPDGFALLGDVGMDNAKRRVSQLTTLMLAELASLRHENGRSMTQVYGPADSVSRGGTVAFNVVDQYGRVVPYSQVERRALERGVSIRGGCFCNPGAAERAFGFPAAETLNCMRRARTEGFTIEGFAACLGGDTAVGAVRASLGIASNEHDVARLLEVVESVSS